MGKEKERGNSQEKYRYTKSMRMLMPNWNKMDIDVKIWIIEYDT